MARSRCNAGALLVIVGAFGWSLPPIHCQHPPESDKKRDEAIQRFNQLSSHQIETKAFAEPLPLVKFLDVLARQLPADKKMSFRIEKEAFGDTYEAVAATPMKLPPVPRQMSLHIVLRLVRSKIETKHDYRIDGSEYVFTTPERALYITAYDIKDILVKPERLFNASPWNAFKENLQRHHRDLPEKAAGVVESIVAAIDGVAGESAPFERAGIQVLNGTRILIRANAERHSEVHALLMAYRRHGDLSIAVNAQLYEVDDAFYTKLKNAPPVDWEEEEKILLGQLPAKPSKGPSFFDLLAKKKSIQSGDEVKVDDGLIVTLLARQHAVSFLGNREHVVLQEKSRKAILEGVTFTAGIHVSPDRRAVRVQLTEKATEIRLIKKVKTWMQVNDPANSNVKEVEIEIPFVNEARHVREFEVPDGGAILIPVHYRPKALQEKNRWWILQISPRIWIQEEEDAIQIGTLTELLPVLVADVLKNPRLKATRDVYGTPGDKRFALIDSDAWTWTKETKIDVPAMQRTPATRTGQRLLGIRIERFQHADKESDPSTLTVTFLNAGGSDNGPVIGVGTIRYHARHKDKGWVVELPAQ